MDEYTKTFIDLKREPITNLNKIKYTMSRQDELEHDLNKIRGKINLLKQEECEIVRKLHLLQSKLMEG